MSEQNASETPEALAGLLGDEREVAFLQPIERGDQEVGFVYSTETDSEERRIWFYGSLDVVREGKGVSLTALFSLLPDFLKMDIFNERVLIAVRNPEGRSVGIVHPALCCANCENPLVNRASVAFYQDSETEWVVERIVDGEVVGREVAVEGPDGYLHDLLERLDRAFKFHRESFGGHRPIEAKHPA